jgi:hypothetical protein
MFPDMRAVVAAMAAAIILLTVAFGVVATLRVAQESRAGSLHADLARRGQAGAAEPQPVVVIETPGPTLLAKAPEVEAPSPGGKQAPTPAEQPETSAQAPQPAISLSKTPEAASASAEPDANNARVAAASPTAPESAPIIESGPEPEPPVASAIVTAVPRDFAAEQEPPSPVPIMALGGPSPEEIAQANAQRKAAERARAKKAAAEKRKKARAGRMARERKLAAQRAAEAQARQQASASGQASAFGFTAGGSFNSAPFGNSFDFGGATNRR